MPLEYACFGLEMLGKCAYDPTHPTVYLTIGNAISALGFTLAVQQLIKPLYRYRLRANGLSLMHLSGGIIIGFIFTLIAAVLPNLPIKHDFIFEYPIFWELLASITILSVYGIASLLILRPVKIRNRNLFNYINAAASFLSEANDEERARFAYDLSYNAKDLFKYASYWDKAEHAFVSIEFARLKAAGKPASIQGQAPQCPFYIFANRKNLRMSQFVRSFLLILADPNFCKVLVKDCPWHTAQLLRQFKKEELYADAAKSFVQEIALQAIIYEDSLMSREVGYEGFAHAPFLSESLFSEWEMIRAYRPLAKVSREIGNKLSQSRVEKLNLASELMFGTALKNGDHWGCQYLFDIEQAYERLCQALAWDKKRDEREYGIDIALNFGIDKIYTMLMDKFPTMRLRVYKSLFQQKSNKNYGQVVEIVADIVFKAYTSIANDFEVLGRNWSMAIGFFMDLFPFNEDEDAGLNPLQQHLVIKFQEKLKHNMEGWYPSLSRVMLAVIGAYDNHPKIKKRTAHLIVRDVLYKSLKEGLPKLHKKDPEKLKDFLPSNVEYDPVANKLVHTYTGGTKAETYLSKINPPDVDPYDLANWFLPQQTIVSLLKAKP